MNETVESLREKGGIDLTKLTKGARILVETAAGIYEMTVIDPATGRVSVKATVEPFKAHTPTETALEKSIWDDKGELYLPFWIGKTMMMVFRDHEQKLFATHSVISAKVESVDGSWSYEVWEENQ